MQTVDGLLDAVKRRHAISSDYKLAQFLKMTQHTIANYRHGRSRPDDKTLARLAELGDINPAEIDLLAAQLQAERATNEHAKQLWLRIAGRLQAGAAHSAALLVLFVVALAGFTPNAEAAVTSPARALLATVCILCKQARTVLFGALHAATGAILNRFAGRNHVQSADTDAQHLHFAG